MGCSINKCSPIIVEKSENVPNPQRLHLFDLSDNILRYILRFLPKGTFYVSSVINVTI